jgi:hypothetical protein
MAVVWLALALSLLAVAVSTVFAVVRGIDLLRAFRSLGRGVGRELAAIDRATGEIEGHLAAAARSGDALRVSLARLRRSRAELNVLRSALADARAAAGRLTALWPSK